MAYTEKRLVSGSLLSDTATTYYTASAPKLKVIIKEMTVCNVTGTDASLTLHIVPAAGTASDANCEFKAVTIAANETKIFGRTSVMETGDMIQALSGTADALALSISGVEKT